MCACGRFVWWATLDISGRQLVPWLLPRRYAFRLVEFAIVSAELSFGFLGSTVDLRSFDPDTVSSFVLHLLDLIIGNKLI